jgi:disulfide bond formation protein DsbB
MRNGGLERLGNFIGASGLTLLMILALGFQIIFHELPCPLCLLQRIGFFMMIFGFLMNLRFGSRGIHYAIVLLSGFLTSFIAMRQIILHIIPGTGEYGSPVLGLHLYTWSYIVAIFTMVMTAVLLTMHRSESPKEESAPCHRTTNIIFAVASFVLFANIVSVFLECGLKMCEEDPVRYELLGS